jgi:Mrp family chromosome partitioning ATPase
MASLSNESTPRERLARLVTLMKRARKFRRSAAIIAVTGISLALAVALSTSRVFRSETTVLYRDAIQTQQPGEGESPAARAARLGPKLKDLLYARPKLEQVIREHDLFPEKARRSMLDAIEEMQAAVGFRARAGDSYVISFAYDDPAVARDVAARLAALMIEDYNQQNLDTATLTRDFLRRKQAEADRGVDDASHKLAQFLAEHPQFQWGVNDSPYAPVPAAAGPAPAAPALARAARPFAPADPALAGLERELARTEAELFPGQPARAVGGSGVALIEAQKQRDAAAAALAGAQTALAEKLLTVTPAHPDAATGRAHVEAARQALAGADGALARARAGDREPAPEPARADGLTPARRADLERARERLHRQIADRRASAGRGEGPSPGAPRAEAREAIPDVVELETDWHRLRLELDRAREKLHTIQQTARVADLSADAAARQGHEEMQILEPAYLPTRPDRGHGRIFFAGAAVALFLAFGYAAARVLLDDTLLDEGDVAAVGGPAVLVAMPHAGAPPPPEARAIIPAVPRDDGDDDEPAPVSTAVIPSQRGIVVRADRGGALSIVDAVFDDPEIEVIGADLPPPGTPLLAAPPAALAALRVLRSRLEQRRGDGSLVVSVMSPSRGEGKTTLAMRLALTLSEAERARVILVEGNFEHPRLATALGLEIPAAAAFSRQIHERMRGNGIPWGVVRIGPSLSLLAEPGEVTAHPEALHSAHFESALAALRRNYEYVIIDGPAVMGSGDANVLEAASDGVLLLVRTGSTQGASLSRATQQLGDRRLLGVVMNEGPAAATAKAA